MILLLCLVLVTYSWQYPPPGRFLTMYEITNDFLIEEAFLSLFRIQKSVFLIVKSSILLFVVICEFLLP